MFYFSRQLSISFVESQVEANCQIGLYQLLEKFRPGAGKASREIGFDWTMLLRRRCIWREANSREHAEGYGVG
jgi:hypothetical protein